MSTEPFLGEIKLFGFNYAPRGYAFCSGQLLGIQQNQALFSLLGTTFGGNGTQTFALPDLRSRLPIGQFQGPGLSNYDMGQTSGSQTATLVTGNLPAHTHGATLKASDATATLSVPNNSSSIFAAAKDINGDNAFTYATATPNITLNNGAITIGTSGNNLPFSIMPPTLAINYCVALEGVFPQRP